MGSARYQGGTTHLEYRKNRLKKGLKLHTYDVINEQFGQKIGVIRWRGGWRQYVFRADNEVDMSRGCHKEINKFIDNLMKKWRMSKKGQ